MYKRGVILELRKKKAIIFNDSGEYEKIDRIEGMFVGQVVDYIEAGSKHKNRITYAMSVAAVLIAVLLSYSVFKNFRNEVFAYVTLDMNPSMEFSINDKNRVVDLKPLNVEAEKLTKGLSVKGKDISLALSSVMEQLTKLGYFDVESDNIIILSTSTSELWDEDDKRNIQISEIVALLKEIIKDRTNNHAHIETISASPELRSLSIKSDMSVGRYALYTKALEEGKDISLQDAKTVPLSQLLGSQDSSANNPEKTSNSENNTDDSLKSDIAQSNKNSEESKEDLSHSENTQTDTLGSKTEDKKTETITNDQEDTKKALPGTTMPKFGESSQTPGWKLPMPYNKEEPPGTKPPGIMPPAIMPPPPIGPQPKGGELEPFLRENTGGEMRDTIKPSPDKQPKSGKSDIIPEGEKPDMGIGIPGGNVEKDRPLIDEGFMKKPGVEKDKEENSGLPKGPDKILPDKGKGQPGGIG